MQTYLSPEELNAEVVEWAAQLWGTTEPFTTLGRTPEHFRRFLTSRPDYRLLVATIDGQRCGAAWAKPYGFASSPYLAVLGVAAEYRNRGVGAALLAAYEALFPEARHLFLCVSSFNDGARRFYERHGYVHRGTLPAYIVADHDEHVMHKRRE